MRNPRPETTRHGHPSPPGAVPATALVLVAFACLFASRPAPASAQAFGAAVLVADGRILAGEAAHEREPGTVRAYAYDGGWAQVAALRAPEPAPRDGFGSALASSGEFLFVGADRTGAGRVYVYRLSDIGVETPVPSRRSKTRIWPRSAERSRRRTARWSPRPGKRTAAYWRHFGLVRTDVGRPPEHSRFPRARAGGRRAGSRWAATFWRSPIGRWAPSTCSSAAQAGRNGRSRRS